MKKLVIFTEQLYGGGVERILQIIANNFNYKKYDVTIFTVRQDNPSLTFFPSYINFKYVFETYNDTSSWWNKLCCKIENKIKLFFYYNFSPSLFYRLFIREKADIAIAFIEGYATRLVSGFPKRTKKIAWVHIELNNFHWSKIAYKKLKDEKNAYLSMDKIVCVSKIVKEQLNQLYFVSEKSVVLYNPINPLFVIESSNVSLVENDIGGSDSIILVTVGTLNERKGQSRLLRIFSKLVKEGYNVELWIIGAGNIYNELSQFIKENCLGNRAFLLGYKDNPFPYMKRSDIYVCSSYAEGYNTAITEALVLGKAVVSTECSGVKEQLGEHNEWGICVPNTEDDLYVGLKQMLNPTTLKHYTEQATIRGKDFTLEKSMNKIYQLIEE